MATCALGLTSHNGELPWNLGQNSNYFMIFWAFLGSNLMECWIALINVMYIYICLYIQSNLVITSTAKFKTRFKRDICPLRIVYHLNYYTIFTLFTSYNYMLISTKRLSIAASQMWFSAKSRVDLGKNIFSYRTLFSLSVMLFQMKRSHVPSADYCARFYVLPKTHKINITLRPIVSYWNHDLSIWEICGLFFLYSLY